MSGFEAQTYTQVPNSLFAIMHDMEESELKVVLLICRYTFGYHRDEIRLSIRRIAREIGMSKNSAERGAEAALKRGLIERVSEGRTTTTWRALVQETVPVIDPVPTVSTTGAVPAQLSQPVGQPVSIIDPQVGLKESNKEINSKESGAGSAPAPRERKMDVIAWEQNKAAMAAKREEETGIKAALLDRFNEYPAECRFTLMWLQDCYQWPASSIPVRSKSKKRNAEYAYWVESLRNINNLLAGVTDKHAVLSAAARKLEDVTVSGPASLVKTVAWAVGQHVKRQQAQQARQQERTLTPFQEAMRRERAAAQSQPGA